MQHDAAGHLHIEMALAEDALCRLAHGGESLDQEIVERLALRQALLELSRAIAQALVVERHELGLERVDLLDQRREAFYVTVIR